MLTAAAELLQAGGVDAVSTRAVAARAGVQPPTIYRQFGDKDGLLDAVTHFVLQNYLHAKRRILNASNDPVDDLRRTWDLHVDFGLKHPAVYTLTYGGPRPGKTATAAAETIGLLKETIARIGDRGRLRMSVERATEIVHAAGVGVVLTMIPVPSSDRDHQLPVIVRENMLSAILTDGRRSPARTAKLSARAVALAEAIRGADELDMTPAERALLTEWLARLANQPAPT
jgi:AcrR family transcriptional regulator